MIFSPSALKTFVQCPYKFKAQYIDKSIKWEQSESAKRGEQLHALMETACNHGWDSVKWTDSVSEQYAKQFVGSVWKMKDAGWTVQTEVSLATDGYGNALDFWDKEPQNFLRCRVDLMATHPEKDLVIIYDWKSGKAYDLDRLQLQVNAMCAVPVTNKTKYSVAFCYLDNGAVKSESIDVTNVTARESNPTVLANSPCVDAQNAINGALKAIEFSNYPQTKNRFCAWCQVKECPYASKN